MQLLQCGSIFSSHILSVLGSIDSVFLQDQRAFSVLLGAQQSSALTEISLVMLSTENF